MQLVFLGIVFLVIVILLALKRPLYQAILGALIAAALLYRIPPRAILSQTARVFTDWNSFSVLVSLYLITYLQLILVLILAFDFQVVTAVLTVIVLAAFVYRFSFAELKGFLVSAFEVKLLLNTFLILVLKEFISYTGVLTLLPAVLSTLPIPEWLVFAIMFFVGGAISGSNGIIALGTPLAFSALDGGIPLMVLLMCMCHAASLISPVHVCLVVASDYFKITMGQLIRKTIPASLVFALLMIGYYLLLTAIV